MNFNFLRRVSSSFGKSINSVKTVVNNSIFSKPKSSNNTSYDEYNFKLRKIEAEKLLLDDFLKLEDIKSFRTVFRERMEIEEKTIDDKYIGSVSLRKATNIKVEKIAKSNEVVEEMYINYHNRAEEVFGEHISQKKRLFDLSKKECNFYIENGRSYDVLSKLYDEFFNINGGEEYNYPASFEDVALNKTDFKEYVLNGAISQRDKQLVVSRENLNEEFSSRKDCTSEQLKTINEKIAQDVKIVKSVLWAIDELIFHEFHQNNINVLPDHLHDNFQGFDALVVRLYVRLLFHWTFVLLEIDSSKFTLLKNFIENYLLLIEKRGNVMCVPYKYSHGVFMRRVSPRKVVYVVFLIILMIMSYYFRKRQKRRRVVLKDKSKSERVLCLKNGSFFDRSSVAGTKALTFFTRFKEQSFGKVQKVTPLFFNGPRGIGKTFMMKNVFLGRNFSGESISREKKKVLQGYNIFYVENAKQFKKAKEKIERRVQMQMWWRKFSKKKMILIVDGGQSIWSVITEGEYEELKKWNQQKFIQVLFVEVFTEDKYVPDRSQVLMIEPLVVQDVENRFPDLLSTGKENTQVSKVLNKHQMPDKDCSKLFFHEISLILKYFDRSEPDFVRANKMVDLDLIYLSLKVDIYAVNLDSVITALKIRRDEDLWKRFKELVDKVGRNSQTIDDLKTNFKNKLKLDNFISHESNNKKKMSLKLDGTQPDERFGKDVLSEEEKFNTFLSKLVGGGLFYYRLNDNNKLCLKLVNKFFFKRYMYGILERCNDMDEIEKLIADFNVVKELMNKDKIEEGKDSLKKIVTKKPFNIVREVR